MNQDFDTTVLIAQFRDAAALAARAKTELDSCRSLNTDKAKAALKVWDLASQNAVRLARSLRLAGTAPKTLDDELDALLTS